jgi:acyl-CoA synthetase (AMP-forming)/AMP-acid ligase II
MVSPTGGTTGLPKGVMNTHRSLSVCLEFLTMSVRYCDDEPIVNLAALPMTHASGVFSLAATARGGEVVVLPKAEPGAVLDAIERHRVTELFLAPTAVYRLMEVPGLAQRDLASLRYLLYAAAPMSTEKLRRAIDLFGPVLAECYGQTEAFAGISFLSPEEHFVDGRVAPDSRLASCGRPNPLISVEIHDGEDKPVAAGESGEICVRGDLVMKGYYKAPEQTAQAIVDGWLHTGDIGHFDADGYLYVVDRKKDLIIRGGFNVFPRDVEDVLLQHPAVAMAGVVGRPDERLGEEIVAFVSLRPDGQATPAEITEFARARLAAHKYPREVNIVAAIPLTSVGKLDRKTLRRQVAEQ